MVYITNGEDSVFNSFRQAACYVYACFSMTDAIKKAPSSVVVNIRVTYQQENRRMEDQYRYIVFLFPIDPTTPKLYQHQFP